MANPYRRIARLKDTSSFEQYIQSLEIELPFDEEVKTGAESLLGQPVKLPNGRLVGNHFCTSPMEGWDGTDDGKPTEHTFRRWRNFGKSGAKLIWGGEAVAVRHDGRANPNQLLLNTENAANIEQLRRSLINEHKTIFGSSSDLVIGLQLTHSGRFCRPNQKGLLEPKIVYHHPVIDKMFNLPQDYPLLEDWEIGEIIDDFVTTARLAQNIGFDFVDIKHCHGYLGHEFLSAYTRTGEYGGSFENRTSFLREIVRGIRQDCPELMLGVRLSAFDFPPFYTNEAGQTVAEDWRDEENQYPFAFGSSALNPFSIDYQEIFAILKLLEELDIWLVNISGGSPYYTPHLTRPAYFPPSDGYQPPEDPLIGVARHIEVTKKIKGQFPEMIIIGSAYSYLQEWLPNVAQYNIRNGLVDFVGLGRMILSYPEFPADIIDGNPYNRKRICRTFSDCTTAPRNGLISGCYPLDDYYKSLPESDILKAQKGS